MNVSELQTVFLQDLQTFLPEWRFVSSFRHFKRSVGTVNWLFHIACVNHPEDFDAIGDVAVEFLLARKRVVIVGAQLGNISGVGQTRHPVSSPEDCAQAARSLVTEFQRVGLPFLERYSSAATVLSVLQSGGTEASLISPLRELHGGQIAALQALGAPPNKSFKPNPLRGSA
ncbi:hypothetical protein [Cognatiluteimonas telluris]|uniref:hypothetical protein n=1 Tax=Cognatiluteimonas telluris TaxID=1104775 RepID=UPI0014090A20|nr:hypothetical protein [Lysobacter telluris]